MAITYIRGKQGLVEELEQRRKRLENRIENAGTGRGLSGPYSMTRTVRLQLEAEIGNLTQLIGWLSMDGVKILSEAEYDAKMASWRP